MNEKLILRLFPCSTALCEITGRPELNDFKKTVADSIIGLASGITVISPVASLNGKNVLSAVKEQKQPSLPTIYSDQLLLAERALNQVNEKRRNKGEKDLRFVIFIDDLDRCAPQRALEVLESVKVLLGIKGIVYVLGLSPEIAGRCIDHKYRDVGIKGEDYIKKIVQIPFTLPEWREVDIKKYLSGLMEQLDPKYQDIFRTHVALVAKGVQRNPREIKRFINSYIIQHEVFGLDPGVLMLLQILRSRWPELYELIFESPVKFKQLLGEVGVFFV